MGLNPENVFKSFSNVPDVLEKAAKLPEGSKRKFGPNWYIKQGGKWKYLPSSEHKVLGVGKHAPDSGGGKAAAGGEKSEMEERLVEVLSKIDNKEGTIYKQYEARLIQLREAKANTVKKPEQDDKQAKPEKKDSKAEFNKLNMEHYAKKVARADRLTALVGETSGDKYSKVTGEKAEKLRGNLSFTQSVPDWGGEIPAGDGKKNAILYQKGGVIFGVYKKDGEVRFGTIGEGGIDDIEDFKSEINKVKAIKSKPKSVDISAQYIVTGDKIINPDTGKLTKVKDIDHLDDKIRFWDKNHDVFYAAEQDENIKVGKRSAVGVEAKKLIDIAERVGWGTLGQWKFYHADEDGITISKKSSTHRDSSKAGDADHSMVEAIDKELRSKHGMRVKDPERSVFALGQEEPYVSLHVTIVKDND